MEKHAVGKVIVLVVEDEPILRMMAVDVVESAGFEAIEANNADAAFLIKLLTRIAGGRPLCTYDAHSEPFPGVCEIDLR